MLKRKYIPFKMGKNLSEKLLCVLLIHLTELQLSRKEPFTKAVVVEFAKWYLEAHWGLCWKRKYAKIKTEKKVSEKLLCVLLMTSQSYSFPFKKPFGKAVLVEFGKWYLEAHRGLRWKRKYFQLKTGKKFSQKLLSILLIHLTELLLSRQEAFH